MTVLDNGPGVLPLRPGLVGSSTAPGAPSREIFARYWERARRDGAGKVRGSACRSRTSQDGTITGTHPLRSGTDDSPAASLSAEPP